MTPRAFASSRRGLFDVAACAIHASAAVESGRQPDARALRRLGIDPERFRQIGRV